MAEEPLPSGWLPPRPPSHPTSPAAPQRTRGSWPPPAPDRDAPPEPRLPSSPTAVSGIALGVAAVLLLLLSAGVWFPVSLALSASALLLGTRAGKKLADGTPGRPGQVRAAVTLGRIGLALSALAAVTWIVLTLNDITPTDLQELLERERDRLESR